MYKFSDFTLNFEADFGLESHLPISYDSFTTDQTLRSISQLNDRPDGICSPRSVPGPAEKQ